MHTASQNAGAASQPSADGVKAQYANGMHGVQTAGIPSHGPCCGGGGGSGDGVTEGNGVGVGVGSGDGIGDVIKSVSKLMDVTVMPNWLKSDRAVSRFASNVFAMLSRVLVGGTAMIARMRTDAASTSTVTADAGTPAASAMVSRVFEIREAS